ncbi:TPA: hypothetical protein HA361_04830 [Candidatus Woesearchaeota archaeon]|nr:hypothetical protein [Candidatus Woesearchaeota archaeon]HII69235.1 hypothetical protein [Candidatus Woesearchaeota archaeon]
MGKVIELAKKKQELLEDKVGEKEQKQIVEDIQYLTRLADPDFQGEINQYLQGAGAGIAKEMLDQYKKGIKGSKVNEAIATAMEKYTNKAMGEAPANFKGDKEWWLSRARATLGDHYTAFKAQLQSGDFEGAMNTLKEAYQASNVNNLITGIIEKINSESPAYRIEFGKKVADMAPANLKPQAYEISRQPERAYEIFANIAKSTKNPLTKMQYGKTA